MSQADTSKQIEAIRQLVTKIRSKPRPRFMELPWIERVAWLHVMGDK